MVEVTRSTPPDDRTPERRVFAASEKTLLGVMARACKAAGIAHYTPHDLRHRYISLMIKRGAPITAVSAAVGHSKTSLTLDTYAHVLLDEDDA